MFDFFKESSRGEIIEIKLSELKEFSDNMFSPYVGERFEELVESVKAYGVISPIVVREIDGDYETLSGHNRVNACKAAGFKTVQGLNIRELERNNKFSSKGVTKILLEQEEKELPKVRLSQELIKKYFVGYEQKAIEEVLEKALAMWFGSN